MSDHGLDKRDEVVGVALRALPMPESSPAFFEQLRMRLEGASQVERASSVAMTRRVNGKRRMAMVVATALLSSMLGAVVGASVQASPDCGVVSFEPADGWNTVETTYGADEDDLPTAWAANGPFEPEKRWGGFPDNTIADLPPNGIVITAVQPRLYEGGENIPSLRLPLRVEDGWFNSDQYEGQPAPHVSNYVLDTYVDGRVLNVMVWMGRNDPAEEMISAANEELSRLCVPNE